MKKHESFGQWTRFLSIATTGLAVAAITPNHAVAEPASATVLEFANSETLFVADSNKSRIYAYEIPERPKAESSTSYKFEGFGGKVAELLKVAGTSLSYHDIAIHPNSGEAFVSLSVLKGGKVTPAIICADQKGSVSVVDLAALKSTHYDLTKTADDGVTFWRDIPATTFTVTDLDFNEGTLYVSGLSTGEFASTLRKIPFPFDGTSESSSIEIYHTVHDQSETRAPIRAMTVMKLNGKSTVVAAYTCTPLVTISADALKDGSHVKGKTVAELGYGNTPLDVIKFSVQDQKGKSEDFVLVVNKERSANLINTKDLAEAANGEGLSKPELWGHAGVKFRPLPLGGVMQVADQDAQYLAMLKRNMDTGDVDLVSYRKGAYFRLSDFVSEYNFPDYQYNNPAQEFYRGFQNMLKADEGYPELAREPAKK